MGASFILFERPQPYLLVTPDGKQQIQYLPDPSQRYVITVNGLFGSGQLSPTLQDGWNLTSINLAEDNQQVLSLLGAALSAATAIKPPLPVPLARPRIAGPAPGLYKIDLAGGRVVGPLPLIRSPTQ